VISDTDDNDDGPLGGLTMRETGVYKWTEEGVAKLWDLSVRNVGRIVDLEAVYRRARGPYIRRRAGPSTAWAGWVVRPHVVVLAPGLFRGVRVRVMATQAQIAEHLDLSIRRVQDLVVEGVLERGADLDQCRVSYIRYLRGGASGKHTGATPILADGRARLVKLQGDKVEIELAELRGEVVRADDVSR
jgi:hypothetical protein